MKCNRILNYNYINTKTLKGMKINHLKTLFATLLFFGLVFGAASCSDNNNDIVETQWNVENIPVKAADWTWDAAEGRFFATKQLEFIDEFIYESGAVLGYVFIGQQGSGEVQYQLPYTRSYVDGENTFSETISYQFSASNNRVTFFIEPSDSFQDNNAKVDYNFRIVMIW